jgi:shikimate kinase
MNEQAQSLIVITGFMGAGKTTVALALSSELRCEMVDLDAFITERFGRSPQMIIDEDGEELFRELESQALSEVLDGGRERVIALGGGAWTIARNRALVNEHGGFTIWLNAPFELCWRRIESERTERPLGRDFNTARELYDRRRAFYDEATFHVEVSEEKTAQAIAAEIIDALLKDDNRRIPAKEPDKIERDRGSL